MPFKHYVSGINPGLGGLNGSRNKSNLDPDELLIASNVTFEGDIIGKEGGATKYNSTAVPTAGIILGGYDFWPSVSTQRMIVYTNGGYLLKDTGDALFSTTLKTGLNVTKIPVFVTGGEEALASSRKLFLFNGYDSVQVLAADGASTTNIATPPADWSSTNQPNCGCVHEGRLWGALGHRVYFSKTTNHEDFTAGSGATDGGTLVLWPGVGNEIKQMLSFKGVLLVFKEPRGIFLIDTASTSISDWKVMQLNGSIGVASSHSAVQIDDDILFMDSTGSVQIFSGIDNFNITGANLSQNKQMNVYVQENVNIAELEHVKAVFYPAKREVHFAVPQTSATYNTARLVLDLNRPSQPRWRWSPRDVCESLWLRKDSQEIPRIVCGDATGFVWLLDQDARSKAGAAYLGAFQTPHMDFGNIDPLLASRQKLGAEIEILAEPREGITLSIDVYWDNEFRHTITMSLNPQGTALGTFVLGTNVLGSDQLLSIRRKKLLGSGRRLSLRFYNEEVAGDFAIARCYVRFKAGNERISHS